MVDVPKMKDLPDLLLRIDELSKVLKLEGLKKKRGRPKKEEWLPWPQADIANTVYWWAVYRILLPLPEYFYNPNVKNDIEGFLAPLVLLSLLNENVVSLKARESKDSSKKRVKSKKRNLATLKRDSYYYLLKNEGKKKTYTDTANYLLEEGLYENNQFASEDEEYQIRKKLSGKISKACRRFEQFAKYSIGQNN